MAGRKSGAPRLSAKNRRRLAEIERCGRRGESLKNYAQRTGESVHALYGAKRQARRAGLLPPARGPKGSAPPDGRAVRLPRFVEAAVPPASESAPMPSGGVAWRLRLPSGAVLESATRLDGVSLERLLCSLVVAQ